jgi:hypothetical protein
MGNRQDHREHRVVTAQPDEVVHPRFLPYPPAFGIRNSRCVRSQKPNPCAKPPASRA